MKKVSLYSLIFILIFPAGALAQYGSDQTVQGHIRNDGTFVQPHHRTAPDHDVSNNYSTRGNQNPYTGKMGNVDPYCAQDNSFSSPAPNRQPRRLRP